MSALTGNNAALIVRDGVKVSRLTRSSIEIFSGSFVMRDVDGNVRPLITSVAGLFEGIGSGYVGTDSTLYPTGSMKRRVEITKKGAYKVYISGIAATDVGKPVWCITDNPADVTLTYSAGYHCVGKVVCLEYTSTGALSGYAWVAFDTTEPIGLRAIPRGSPAGMRHFGGGGIEYWNDFLNPADATVSKVAGTACFLNTMVDGGGDAAEVIKLVDSDPDGSLVIQPNNAANDQNSLQLNGAPFTPGSTATVFFECRMKLSDVDKVDMIVGMCARGGARYTASGGGFFFRMDHDANLDAVSELGTSEDAQDTTSDMADDTYIVLGILYELATTVKFYVNGTLKITVSDTNDIVTGVDLVPTLEILATDTSQPTMTVDYLLVRQTPRV